MEDAIYYAIESVMMLAFLGIAARLLYRSTQTRAIPERLLGLSFLFWGLSIPIYDVPEALSVEELVLAPFANASRICWQLGTAIMALFVKKVFRNSDSRATGVVVAVAASMIIGGMGSVWVGDYGSAYPLTNTWWWLEWAGSIIPMIWISTEASVYYARVRQRLSLGEGNPLLCNRFGLWCFVGLCWTLVELMNAVQNIVYEVTQLWPTWLTFAIAVLELVGVAMVWLVFYPPVGYRNWINRNAIQHSRAGTIGQTKTSLV